ncbi:unnamed protein product [Rotaria socialis]|uniref:Uncharacterized protein n=1 Tax=Rotaria socialis TaxID=392032 RepID=A0A821XA67_9BILA|nr:unnamed protein product [Rotaria socialis]
MVEHLPDCVTPKVHFITEYPLSINKYGVPVLNSCIRFESKHLYFKQIVIRTFNFKNPLLTLSKRHQLRYCLLSSSKSFSSLGLNIRSSKAIILTDLPLLVRCLLMKSIDQADSISECSSMYYHHIQIRKNATFIRDLAHSEEVPVFCQVHHMLKIKGKWVVIAEELNTVSFDDKLWSYEVEFTGVLISMDVDRCFDILPHCLDCYLVGQSNYINVLTRLTKR